MIITRFGTFVVVFALVVAVSFVGVVIVDPVAPSNTPPEIELSDSPEEIAYTALNRTGTADYTVEGYHDRTINGTPGGLDPAFNHRAKYDNTDGQVFVILSEDSQLRYRFANEHYKWGATNDTETVRKVNDPSLAQPRFPGADAVQGCDCVRVQTDNESTLVLVVNDTATAYEARYGPVPEHTADDAYATVTLYIDKGELELRKAVFYSSYTTANSQTHIESKHIDVYSDWGDTEVERPSWASYSVEEFLYDLLSLLDV